MSWEFDDEGGNRSDRITVAQYMAMPDDGNRYELYHGKLERNPRVLAIHGIMVATIGSGVYRHVRSRRAGFAGVGVDVVMPDDTVLRPDVHFIAARNKRFIRGHIYGPPDLVVEVTSPENWRRDLVDKKVEYERFGVREYWVLNLVECPSRAYRWSLVRGQYRGGEIGRGAKRSEVLQGFKLNPKRLFESIRPFVN